MGGQEPKGQCVKEGLVFGKDGAKNRHGKYCHTSLLLPRKLLACCFIQVLILEARLVLRPR